AQVARCGEARLDGSRGYARVSQFPHNAFALACALRCRGAVEFGADGSVNALRDFFSVEFARRASAQIKTESLCPPIPICRHWRRARQIVSRLRTRGRFVDGFANRGQGDDRDSERGWSGSFAFLARTEP